MLPSRRRLRAMGIDHMESMEVVRPRNWVTATVTKTRAGITARRIAGLPPRAHRPAAAEGPVRGFVAHGGVVQ
jgi:hypothetical protein